MSNFPYLLLILLACPLMMVFMMRGMHGGRDGHAGHGVGEQPDDTSDRWDARDDRLAELEHEVGELRAERDRRRAEPR
jgi:hypothetical protein